MPPSTPQCSPTRTQHSHTNITQDDETPPILFSCKCESARPVTTLLSCLRNVSLSNNLGSGAAAAAIQDATTSILTAPTGGGGGGIHQNTNNTQSTSLHNNSSGFGGRGKVQYATVFVSEKSLTFQVHGVGKQSRATVDIHAGLFSEYHVAEQVVPLEDEDEMNANNDSGNGDGGGEPTVEIIKGGEFGINLTTVLECLCVLGTNALDRTSLCLSYNTHTATFRIELLEAFANSDVILSNCEIPGMAVADDDDEYEGIEPGISGSSPNNENNENNDGVTSNNLDYAFRSYPILARALVKSEFLKDAISELTDVGGSTAATIGISKAGLEFATYGHSTECHVVVPYAGNHPETFISLEGVDDNNQLRGRSGHGGVLHARSYPLHSILSAMRGLEIACETCISINANGMVAIQHQVLDQVGKGNPNFIEFIMCCLEDEYIDEIQNRQSGSGSLLNDDTSTIINGFIDDDETVTIADNDGRSQTQSTYNHYSQELQLLSHQSEVTMSATILEEKENDANAADSSQHSVPNTALFGTVANIGAMSESNNNQVSCRNRNNKKKKEHSTPKSSNEDEADNDKDMSNQKTRRRRLQSNRDSSTINEEEKYKSTKDESNASHSSQGDETDFDEDDELENSLDVTATVISSRRRSSGNNQEEEEISSSPQLMYGDTNLE